MNANAKWPLRAAALAAGTACVAYVAIAAGVFPGFPIVGQGSYCASTVGNSGSATGVPGGGGGGVTGQGAPAGSPCSQTVPAGPSTLTGNELILADTELASGVQPQSVSIPTGLMIAGTGASNNTNALIGSDFGQALWQRGTTPLSAATPSSAALGADGWYNIELAGSISTITVSKQTGAADVPSNSLGSARIQRVASQTGTAPVCTGQLVDNVSSSVFPGKTAIFSVDMFAGATFSPTAGNVSMVIAYHSAADVTSGAANAQGTNTATFASSVAGTQNITNYTEAVNTPTPISATWTRYSVAAAIPLNVPGTTTSVTGIGVKLCFTPVGTAGATDFFEFTKAQLEARFGTSIGPSKYTHAVTSDEWARELARYFQLTENGNSATPVYASGQATTTNGFNIVLPFQTNMRITPITSPITIGGFKINAAGTLQTISVLNAVGVTNTPRTGALSGTSVITAGQGTTFVGTGAGTGVVGFSAEP